MTRRPAGPEATLHDPPRSCGLQAVRVLQRSFKDVGDDLHVAVAMHAESLAGLHSIVVDDPQRAKAHLVRVVVIAEREGMVCVEPAVIELASVGSSPDGDHACLL